MQTITRNAKSSASALTLYTILGFLMFAPLTTYALLVLKGLPVFATAHQGDVLIWVYQMTWIPALIAGGLVSLAAILLTAKTSFFHHPYDFGRCFSLGAISGALAEALATCSYRAISHRPFSAFWIAGATIAGFLTGSATISLLLYYVPTPRNRPITP